jgi:hypothetical protein
MKRILTIISAAAMLVSPTAWAQGMSSGLGTMAKFFGDNKAFTAKVDATVKTPAQTAPMSMEMNISMLDGKLRMDTDASKTKGNEAFIAQMKQMRMDKSVNIVRPDKKLTYMVFPNMKAYAEIVMTDQQAADMMDDSKIEKTPVGKEKIDGHDCEKNKMTVVGRDGAKHDVMVWNAADMKNFPIQMEMSENGNTVSMKYSDVKLEKPDTKVFDPPAAYTKYSSVQSLVQTEMLKSSGGTGGPGAPPQK